ncbi:MAG: alpha/beta hydrolase family protein [Bdellovibrionales bacterium]
MALVLSLLRFDLLLAVSLVAAGVAQAKEKRDPFSPLTGPYPVGTTQYMWVDQNRPELYSSIPGDRRLVIIQAWYPAQRDAATRVKRARYLLSPVEFSGPAQDARKLHQINRHVKTRSGLNAPLAMDKDAYPVLIFNPGGGSSRFTSSFVTEQLASHGFIVLALEHLGDGMSTHFPDGTPLNLDRVPSWRDPDFERRLKRGRAAADEIVRHIQADWAARERYFFTDAVRDSEFVLRRLEAGGLFANRLDLNRVGALGWSQGGATAIHLLVHHPMVRAAVDLDGQFFGSGKATLKTAKPVMLLHSTEATNAKTKDPQLALAEARLNELIRSWNDFLMTYSTGPRYEAEVEGTDHGSFSDWRLFYSYSDKNQKNKAQERERLITHLTVTFFKKHLNGDSEVRIPMFDPLLINSKVLGVKDAQ